MDGRDGVIFGDGATAAWRRGKFPGLKYSAFLSSPQIVLRAQHKQLEPLEELNEVHQERE